ncbi:MAG TPA: hypothetical protein VEX68_24950 [Bryobacteraceae bacterium]|nr:hypothetical protein [Bryobacteraceae bacterium]
MIKAASNFLNQWLVKKNIDKALEYAAPASIACAGHYGADNVPTPSSLDQLADC